MIGRFSNVKIQGMATAVPKIVEENNGYESILGKRRTKKQIKLTGVSKRHISGKEQRTSDLCYAAAVPLIEKLKWKKEEIKVLVYITQVPNYVIPSTAFFLQQRLGLSEDCVCFDINLGCSSFNVGVHVVSALLQSCDIAEKALLLVGDTASQVLKPENNMTPDVIADRMLFGSAGAAIALEKVENHELDFMTRSDGKRFEAIIRHPKRNMQMDGNAVFEFAINDVSEDVRKFKKYFNLAEEDVDYYIFHQAQKLILDNIALDCEIPEGKELRSLEEYGNTSGTSVPLTVCSNLDQFKNKKNVKLLLCGFGVGLSWGMIYSEIPTENILPVIETDEHYDKDKVPQGKLHDRNVLVFGADKTMGECMARFVSDKGASVVLEGTDMHKMQEIEQDLFFGASIVQQEEDLALADKIAAVCKEKEIVLDGIVFAEAASKKDRQSKICAQLQSKGVLKSNVSIVLLAESEMENRETYRQNKENLEEQMAQIEAAMTEENARVNAVVYNGAKMDIEQIKGNGQKWIEQYLQKGCPEEMKRPLFVGKSVVYLLSAESKYSTGILIPINK